jgi:diacylglycerol O-acyltransferase
MKTLSGLDATFLNAENPNTPMNVIGTMIFEGQPDLTYDTLMGRLRERLPNLPLLRRRVVEAPLGIDRPVWIDDAEFDVRNHVLRVMAPSPGGRRELAQLVARTAAEPLDRREPLWQLWLVEGLEDDRTALILKAHHAVMDGVSGAGLIVQLFDGAEQFATAGADPLLDTRADLPQLARHALERVPERISDQASALREVGSALIRFATNRSDEEEAFPEGSSYTAPESPFNASLSPRRSVGYARNSLDAVKRIRESLGGTINDVVLAACTEALRNYLAASDQLPDRALVAGVPVSTRDFERDGLGGNRVSAMRVELPVHIEDPIERYEAVRLNARTAKRLHAVLGARTVESLAELMSPALTRAAIGLYSRLGLAELHPPFVNLAISNVAGPQVALSMCGSPLESIHPHGPLMEGVALNITVTSYAGSLGIGVLGCKRAVPHAEELADGIADAIERLAKDAEEG